MFLRNQSQLKTKEELDIVFPSFKLYPSSHTWLHTTSYTSSSRGEYDALRHLNWRLVIHISIDKEVAFIYCQENFQTILPDKCSTLLFLIYIWLKSTTCSFWSWLSESISKLATQEHMNIVWLGGLWKLVQFAVGFIANWYQLQVVQNQRQGFSYVYIV